MAIKTIPPFPFEIGDTFRAKTSAGGRVEDVEVIGFETYPDMNQMKVLLTTTRKQRNKRIVALFRLTDWGEWKTDLYPKNIKE